MNTPLKLVPLALVASTLLMACATPTSPALRESIAQKAAQPPGPPAAPLPQGTAAPLKPGADGKLADNGNVQQRMVIHVATLQLVMTNVDDSIPEVYKLAADLGGFIQTSNVTKVEGGSLAQMTLKVPAAEMDKAMLALRKMAKEVREEKVTGTDVTAEFADLESQVKNMESAEQQLRGIMAKMDKPEDVLKVFNELTRVRGEIERMKGRMNFLSRSSDLATINISLLPTELPRKADPIPASWSAGAEFNSALKSLQRGLQSLATAAIWLGVVVLPQLLLVLVPLVAGIWLLVKVLRRMAGSGKPGKTANTPPTATGAGA
jgi:hypothetical protein